VTCLLDTHTFLWAIGEPGRLSRKATAVLLDEGVELAVSTASLWEIVLKIGAGKLQLPATREYFEAHLAHLGVQRMLNLTPPHIYALLQLPGVHRDPFDRLLAAQCIVERYALISADAVFPQYGVETIW
jgi:PIN domain nuclease of toxin-antitoxin system